MRLIWKPLALDDRERIMNYIAQNNPQAALDLDALFEQ
ncbi:MAG: type II toxin-antitoxin system RelE/ParE family toxin [Candidatus Nitrotoga sp.]|nr:type II toxin-antitoxin system RelE/ParE family toxin [Candidatus Nitrotoga sp.]